MSPFLARRQYNTPILYVGVQRIACTNIEAAPKRPWKNDLSLRGNFGLHGKTILPPSRPISQHIIFRLKLKLEQKNSNLRPLLSGGSVQEIAVDPT
jgi:hypothetical protein